MPRPYQRSNAQLKHSPRPLLRWSGSEHPQELIRPGAVRRPRVVRTRHYYPRTVISWRKPAMLLLGLCLLLGAVYYGSRKLPVIFTERPTLLISDPQGSWLPELKPQSSLTFAHRIRRGDTLGKVLGGFGVKGAEISAISDELKRLSKDGGKNLSLRAGAKLLVRTDESGLLELQQELGQASSLRVRRKSSGAFEAKLSELPRAQKEVVASGVIETSFAAAALKAGMTYDVVDDFVDLFADRVSFHQDFRRGDRFVMIYQTETLQDGTVIGSGAVLAARLEVGGRSLVALRYVGTDGKARYFNEKGEIIGNTFLRYPLKFTRISSYYADARMHPIFERKMPHLAIDFAAPTGTPVRAVGDGTVLSAGRNGGAGIMIKLNHNARFQTVYMHLSRIDASVRRGRRVSRGQVIGFVGQTGNATGPHLHFALWDHGRPVNPLTASLPTEDDLGRGLRVDRQYLSRVLYTLDHYYSSAFSTPLAN